MFSGLLALLNLLYFALHISGGNAQRLFKTLYPQRGAGVHRQNPPGGWNAKTA